MAIGGTTPTNVISDFKKAGMEPFNRYALEEHEFATAFVTELGHLEVTAKNEKNMTLSADAVAPYV